MTRSPFGSRLASRAALLVALFALYLPPIAQSQAATPQNVPTWLASNREILANEGLALPPPEIRRLVEQPWHLNVAVSQPSPTRKYFLHEQIEEFPPIASYGKPHLYFAGLDVDTKANRARSLTTRSILAFQVIDATTGKAITVEAPKNATLSGASWSPNGRQLVSVLKRRSCAV